MAQALSIDGKEYVSAVAAGKHFGYTKDYLLLLIKQGKIDGQKVGNRWYVHMPSAEYFFTLAKREREVRRKHLSLTRKQELKKISSAHKAEVAEDAEAEFVPAGHKRTALVETLVIVVLGLAVGVMGFLGASTSQYATAHQGVGGFFESLSRGLYGAVTPQDGVADMQHAAVTSSGETAPALPQASETETENVRSVVVLPLESTSADVAAIKDSFSDPVTVVADPVDPDTGVITPEFKNGEGKSYRFLMVPVTESKKGEVSSEQTQS